MSETALAQGTLIAARYRLEQLLGEGGMGTVWSATHTVTRRVVAMKFLKDSVRDRADLQARFLREAAAASSLKHPNVVEIIDVFDFAQGAPVMVMELLEGETLGQKLQRDERLSLEETASLLLPVASAVGAAHALGIVHRDLKPENLFLAKGQSGDITVKVLDFGIAKLSAERFLEGGQGSGLLTESGSLLGTPCYMAPEQASGEQPADHRADIWSLGVILYECLSGVRPIEGESLPQVVARLMSAGIMPLERIAPELPGEITALVSQMLTRELARRTPSLLEVSQALSHYTRVKAPVFGAPGSGSGKALPVTPKTMESARSDVRINRPRGVDPRGPTMLSSPPVNSSVQFTPPPTSSNRTGLILGAAALALAIAGWIWSSTRKAEGPAQTSSGELATLPQAPVKAAATASPEPVATAPASAPEPAHASALGKPHSTRPRPTAQPLDPPKPTSTSDANTLFSGRK